MLREIITSPFGFLSYVGALYIIFRLTFVWRFPLDSIGWKRADYVWLLAALIGVMPILFENRATVSSFQAESVRRDAFAAYIRVQNAIKNQNVFFCHAPASSPESTQDLDPSVQEQHGEPNAGDYENARIAEFKMACDRAEIISEGFEAWSWDRPPPVLHWIESTPRIPNPYFLKDELALLDRLIAEYEEHRERLSEVSQMAEPHPAREILILLSPLLIGFAIALRLAKNTGEIKIARTGSGGDDS